MNLRLIALAVAGSLLLLFPLCSFSQSAPPEEEIVAKIWVDSFNQFTQLEYITEQNFRQQPQFQFGAPKYAYWLKYCVENPSSTAQQWWLEVGVYDSLSLVQITKEGPIVIQRGLLTAYGAPEKHVFRSLQAHKYGFQIELPPNSETTFYLRIKNTIRFEGTMAQIQWLRPDEQQQHTAQTAIGFIIFNAAFFGVFLFFICFSLIQYFQNKDRSYFFYAQYLGLSAAYFWWKFEKSNSFLNLLFTEVPEYYYYFESPLAILIYISYFLFIVHFLNAKKELPKFYHILKIAGPVLVGILFLSLSLSFSHSLSASWELNYWMRYILIPLSFYTIYQVFKRRHQLGFYILTGTSFLLLGGIITSIMSKTIQVHYHGCWDIPLLPIQLGMLAEVLFFSTGLAYKSRLAVAEQTAMRLDLKQQEQETIQLRKRKKELTQLYSNLSHEFRTPLSVILGATAQIKGHTKERQLIDRNGTQLIKLINQVLDLNKVEASSMEVNWQQGDVMLFINYISETYELLAKQKQQTLEINCSTRSLLMDFDTEKLQSMLGNLLANAIKYTPVGGCILLNIYQQEQDRNLCIEVKDNGPGIPFSDQASIFDHYTQLPHTEGGTGLGLAIVSAFTHLLGGTIDLDSTAEQGCTFRLVLPLHNHAPLAKKWMSVDLEHSLTLPSFTHVAPLQMQKGRPTLLLVEDNEDVLQVLQAELQQNYNIFTSKDGQAGLADAKRLQPDLIISDVMMPKMDGYELCRQLKKHATTQRIPFILLTAKAQQEDKLKGLSVEADAYLCKPPQREELHLRIRQLLKKQQLLTQTLSNVFHQADLSPKTEQAAVAFMTKFHNILDNNLQREAFHINDICLLMNTNHVTLNNKIKAYTRQTTASYIRNYRLQTAKKLLENNDLTVAEVAYRVGISEASNFSNMFKKAFGVSPGEWKMEGLVAEV